LGPLDQLLTFSRVNSLFATACLPSELDSSTLPVLVLTVVKSCTTVATIAPGVARSGPRWGVPKKQIPRTWRPYRVTEYMLSGKLEKWRHPLVRRSASRHPPKHHPPVFRAQSRYIRG
jgi:hypothetical protein